MNILELSEQEIFRRRSLEELRALGINPYPADEYVVTGYAREILDTFQDDAPRREVRVAGRVMGRRIMGKASFLELQDSTGRIQIYITRDEICPGEDKTLYNNVVKKLMDIGDFIGVEGEVFRTQMGEDLGTCLFADLPLEGTASPARGQGEGWSDLRQLH